MYNNYININKANYFGNWGVGSGKTKKIDPFAGISKIGKIVNGSNTHNKVSTHIENAKLESEIQDELLIHKPVEDYHKYITKGGVSFGFDPFKDFKQADYLKYAAQEDQRFKLKKKKTIHELQLKYHSNGLDPIHPNLIKHMIDGIECEWQFDLFVKEIESNLNDRINAGMTHKRYVKLVKKGIIVIKV